MIDRWIDIAVAYIEMGIQFILSYMLTIEGVIALVFAMFLVGLVSRIRS